MKRSPQLPHPLSREFFARPATEVAPRLLGCVVEHRTPQGPVSVRLTEVEAYLGERDAASHAFRGRTARNAVMFGPPGHVYVYFTYGMHFCINLVCEPEGVASAVLLRAGEVFEGVDQATARRAGAPGRDLARGPARLTVALGIARGENGADACSPASALTVREGSRVGTVLAGPRVGVAAAAAQSWRFWLADEPTVSVYRAHVPRRRSTRAPDVPKVSDTQGFLA